jgi:hypothetical protein
MNFPLQLKLGEDTRSGGGARDFVRIWPAPSESGFLEVPAGGSIKLTLELLHRFDGDLKLMFQDLNSVSGQWQSLALTVKTENKRSPSAKAVLTSTVPVGSEDEESRESVKPNALSLSTIEAKRSAQLLLRGCKRLVYQNSCGDGGGTEESIEVAIADECRYELDLGQQDLGSAAVIKRITLENSSNSLPCSYKIRVIGSDNSWMSISRTEGTLAPRPELEEDNMTNKQTQVTSSEKPAAEHAHHITLSFFPLLRNLYSAYIVIQNLSDPNDWKHIRIMMEVSK